MSFDELYHKEKSLIDNVIKAFNDLKQKRERLPNPVGDRNFIEAGEVPEAVLIAANMHSESQFVRDQRRQNYFNTMNNGDSANAGNYQYLMQHQDEFQINDEALIAQFGSQYLVVEKEYMGNLDHKDLKNYYNYYYFWKGQEKPKKNFLLIKLKQEMAKREEIQQNGVKAKDAHKFPLIKIKLQFHHIIAQFVSKDGNFGILNDVQSFDKPGRKFNQLVCNSQQFC